MKLTKIPIIIYYGDFIQKNQTQIRVQMAGEQEWKWQKNGVIQ
jgi:hypothetical protein